MKKIEFRKNGTKEINLRLGRSFDLQVVVKAGIKGALVVQNGIVNIKVKVERNGNFHLIKKVENVNQAGGKAIIELVGNGAESLVSGIFHGQSENKHDFQVVMHHRARATKGDILIRGVYEDNSRGYFSGLIRIDKKAQQTNSYFTDNILLLDKAMATSEPTLEIEANDVKASHGSTTGKIDENQLFYLTSRGITQTKAKKMIINAFFQPVLKRLPG